MNFFKKAQNLDELCAKAKLALDSSDAVVVGAGAGLSTSAGFTYSGERFEKYFSDFASLYDFRDMYSGGFYPYETLEEHWAYWSRYIWINRYMDSPKNVYGDLLKLTGKKNYFVLTTNVDHYFQKAGFSKERIFYTQGDYGLFQCSDGSVFGTTEKRRSETHDNRGIVKEMLLSQGFLIGENDELIFPEGGFRALRHKITTDLIPLCPHCKKPMSMNLRADNTFVEDSGWHKAALRYEKFLNENLKKKIAFLELGVGSNTPGIIKYPFWQMTAKNPNATYVCINYGEAVAPHEIEGQSVCINSDIGNAISLMNMVK